MDRALPVDVVRSDPERRGRPEIRTWKISRSAEACGGPSGDRIFSLPLRSGRTAVVSLDIAGHGSSRATLSLAVARTIIASLTRDPSPAVALGYADRYLRTSGDTLPYAVAFIALLHTQHRSVLYASAGHDCAFILDSCGHARPLATTTPMLGVPLTVNPIDVICELSPADLLVIATDGISDSRPAGSRSFFGADGAARAIVSAWQSEFDPAAAAFAAALAHAEGRLSDDASVLVAQRSQI
jgi:sigma-B regulation protein RsbU (phosphoserine phosphatase)